MESWKTIIGRDREPKEELAGERVVGVGTGPTRQLDVVSEVGCRLFDSYPESPSREGERSTSSAEATTQCGCIEAEQSSLCVCKGGLFRSEGAGRKSTSPPPSSSSCALYVCGLMFRDTETRITTIAATGLDQDQCNTFCILFLYRCCLLCNLLGRFGYEAQSHVPRTVS